jgi:hypothetical protein
MTGMRSPVVTRGEFYFLAKKQPDHSRAISRLRGPRSLSNNAELLVALHFPKKRRLGRHHERVGAGA